MSSFKIVLPSAKLVNMENKNRIEYCGRVCYNSRDKIGDGTADKFIERIVKNGHESVLEHSNIIVRVSRGDGIDGMLDFLSVEAMSDTEFRLRVTLRDEGESYIISGNVRSWRKFLKKYNATVDYDNCLSFLDELLFGDIGGKPLDGYIISEDEVPEVDLSKHSVRTLDIITDLGVTHEFVRHRNFSYSQQSTRYCNFFGGLVFCQPWWWGKKDIPMYQSIKRRFIKSCYEDTRCYEAMIKDGAIPQMARGCLPKWLATEICATGTIDMWQDFLRLRDDTAAHPDMQVLAKLVRKELDL